MKLDEYGTDLSIKNPQTNNNSMNGNDLMKLINELREENKMLKKENEMKI